VGAGSLFACGLLIEPLAAAIRAPAAGRMLDAGCGDVPYYGIYRHLVTGTTCIDWPGSSHGAAYVDAFVDLNSPLPFAAASFDAVLLADVLEHVAEPDALVGELGRVLAPGGALILSVPFLYWVHEAPNDYYRYTEFALRRLCARAGLEVQVCAPWGGHPDVLVDLVGKLVVRGGLMGRSYAAACGALARTRPYRWLRTRTERAFPLGYVLVARRAG
jgi:SAM-dependent methyltransferase